MSKFPPPTPLVRVRTRTRSTATATVSDTGTPKSSTALGDTAAPSLVPTQRVQAEPYAVGYKRPPRHTQFQKGQSGNRKGRPKGALNITTIVADVMGSRRAVKVDGRDRMMSGAEIMLQQQAKKAMIGDHKATQLFIKLLQEGETKTALAAAASAACSSSSSVNEGIGETEAAILSHHYRAELEGQGVDEKSITIVLTTLGLASKGSDQ